MKHRKAAYHREFDIQRSWIPTNKDITGIKIRSLCPISAYFIARGSRTTICPVLNIDNTSPCIMQTLKLCFYKLETYILLEVVSIMEKLFDL